MDKIRTAVPTLPKGWVKEIVIRKSGASAGKSDVYYYSPEGKKCRSKPQMLQYLPDDFNIENFDFRAGKNTDAVFKKKKRRREDFNFGRDFNISGSDAKPCRQVKKDREIISAKIMKKEEHGSHYKKHGVAENEQKKRRAENLSQRYTTPKQLFWQRRLQHLKPVNESTLQFNKSSQLSIFMKDILPGSNNQALLNSVWYSLFVGNKVAGQHASTNALRKHPTALCNIDQPFTTPFTITEEMLHMQEKKVEAARKKLCEAHELLCALEDEDDDDIDDMEE